MLLTFASTASDDIRSFYAQGKKRGLDERVGAIAQGFARKEAILRDLKKRDIVRSQEMEDHINSVAKSEARYARHTLCRAKRSASISPRKQKRQLHFARRS